MKSIIITLLVFVLATSLSCTTDGSSETTSVICNSSESIISIHSYVEGKMENSQTIHSLSNGTCRTVLEDDDFGKGIGFTYVDELWGSNIDSVLIIFNEIDTLTHFAKGVQGDSSGGVFYNDFRSIFKSENWEQSTLFENKHSLETEFRYSITKDDYNLAKE